MTAPRGSRVFLNRDRFVKAALVLGAVLLAGCAHIQFADGERVSLEHDNVELAQLQVQADKACVQSGGKAPAVLVSNLPVADILPASMTRHAATYRCAR